MKNFRASLLFSLAFLIFQAGFVVRPAEAQHWQQVSVPPSLHIFVPYFINRDYGFIYTPGMTGFPGPYALVINGNLTLSGQTDPASVYRTTNGGQTWNQMNSGEIGNQSYAVILQMCFDSASHGYLVAFDTDFTTGHKGGLYETTDSGADWNLISPPGMAFESLCISDSLVYLIEAGPLGSGPDSIIVYNKNAKTFRRGTGSPGVSIVSNGGPVIYTHHYDTTRRSIDGGKTWLSAETGVTTNESWSLYAIKGTDVVMRSAENITGYANNAPCYSNIQVSTDAGATWKNSFVLGPYPANTFNPMIGDANGDACTMYVSQTLFAPDSGLLRSTDEGTTWKQVGGPIHSCDGRSLSVDEKGAVVYAAENEGDLSNVDFSPSPWTHLWKTTDGGDGFFNRVDTPTVSIGTIPSVTACDRAQTTLSLNYQSCYVDLSLDSVTVSGDTQYFSLDSLPSFPTVLDVQGSSGFIVKFNPQLHPGTYTDSIHIHASVPGQTATFDTVIAMKGTATPVPPAIAQSALSLAFGTITNCIGNPAFDTVLTFTNMGCGPDTITGLALTGMGFSDGNYSTPIVIQPGDSILDTIRFLPLDTGMYSGSIRLFVSSMGVADTPSVTLSGASVQGFGVLAVASTSLQAGRFSFCAGDTTLFDTLRNTGCDTLAISNQQFTSDGTFSLLSSSNNLIIPPNDSSIVEFMFAPRAKGAHSAIFSFHSQNIVNDTGTNATVLLSGTGLGGATILSADSVTRDFGALYVCESRDTTVTLANTGCDTLTVDSAKLSNTAYTSTASYPIVLAPDASVTIPVHLEGDSLGMTGNIEFFSNANSGSPTITVPLTAQILHPATLQLVLTPSDTATAGQIVTCYAVLSGTVPTALTSLHFTVAHNDDLLGFQQAAGMSVTRGPQNHGIETDTFVWVPSGTHTDTIGTITFEAFLTDSSFTPLTLSNIQFTNQLALAPDCLASIQDSSASFTYLFTCGEPIMQDALNGLPFTIQSIVPNPASTEITVMGTGLTGVSVELYNLLGQTAPLVRPSPLLETEGEFDLNVSSLPSGTYYLRLSAGGEVQTRRIVKE